MNSNTPLKFRLWRYFRDGFSIYVSVPLAVINFLTISYYLLLERIPFLTRLFPNFTIYAFTATLAVIPISVLLGWWHIIRSQAYGTESILATIQNPLVVHNSRISYENTLKIFEALHLEPDHEFLNLLEYWRKLDKESEWRP